METHPETLCFIPCCKSKTAYSDRRFLRPTLTSKCIPETWQNLHAARKMMSACIEANTRPCNALHQYDGGLYRSDVGFRDEVTRCINSVRLDLYIVSAGYGLVHALDPIRPYEAEMKGKVATFWRSAGLVEVISELIRVSRAERVFGFFAGPSHWSGAHAKYRYFFTEGVKAAVAKGTRIGAAACFYRETGQGTKAITGALGRTLLRGARSNFSSRFLAEHEMGRTDGNIVIRSDRIVGTR